MRHTINPFNIKAVMLDIPEPSTLALRMLTCVGSSEPLSHYEIMSVDSFNFNRAGSRALHHCMHARIQNILSEGVVRGGGGGGGPDPLSPSGSAHGMHLKEGTCLKCSVIIGRKVGLDYNSWYACLPLIRHVGRSSFANFDIRS